MTKSQVKFILRDILSSITLRLNGHFEVEFICLKQARKMLIKNDQPLNQKLVFQRKHLLHQSSATQIINMGKRVYITSRHFPLTSVLRRRCWRLNKKHWPRLEISYKNKKMKRFHKKVFSFVKFVFLILLLHSVKMDEDGFCRARDSTSISLLFRTLHKGTLISSVLVVVWLFNYIVISTIHI